MLVASYLPSLLFPRLLDAVRDVGAEHVRASSLEELGYLIRRSPVSVLVVDPYAEGVIQAQEIAQLMREFPSIPVVAYTQFIPPALKALTLLAKQGLQETVLFQIDDSRARFGRLLVRASSQSLATRLLDELHPERDQLAPPALATAVEDLFRRPHAYTSARDLVLASGTPLTTMYRAMTQAGFAPPKQVFMAARLLRAACYLRDPGYTIEEVAGKSGYRNPRVLTQHTVTVFGARPSALRKIPEDELVSTLVTWTRKQRSPLPP